MGSRAEKKAKTIAEYECEDRLSLLPDELIHKIYSFLDAKEAVQASVLSKRWKFIWTSLPFLGFGRYEHLSFITNLSRYSMFIRHVLSNRNHQSHVSELKMYFQGELTVNRSVSRKKFRGCVIKKFIQYAISHNVQDLDICLDYRHKPCKLSTFSSKSLKKLKLDVLLVKESDCWDLPALTTLHLIQPRLYDYDCKLPVSWLTSLPALRTLRLRLWDLSKMSFFFPNLTTLCLDHCDFPQTVWHLPALLTLHLDADDLPMNMSDLFSVLVNLQNLKLKLGENSMERDHFISCPQLLNLSIKTNWYTPPYGNIVVSAPQLCNFSSFGIFSITFAVTELENVSIKLNGWLQYVCPKDLDMYYQRFRCMLSGYSTAKNLSFDLQSIEVLAYISNCLASFSSPFHHLKCVKLPKEYKESTIPGALRNYLLGGSPGATIVTSLPQKNRIPQTQAVLVAAENVVLQETSAASTKELRDCQYKNRTVSFETVDQGVQEQHVMENSLVDANDRVSPSRGNRDFGLWQGHEVKSEFVCLLDRIMHKYPETFEHFTPNNKKLCTMNLNMLCTSLNDFTKISIAEVDSEIIVECRDVFAYLQNLGFDVSWLVNRLNYIEHLRFSKPLIPELHAIDCHINDAKSKLQDLQALRIEKMTEIQDAFGTTGANLAAGLIGDDLLSGP